MGIVLVCLQDVRSESTITVVFWAFLLKIAGSPGEAVPRTYRLYSHAYSQIGLPRGALIPTNTCFLQM